MPLLGAMGVDVVEYCPRFGGKQFRPGILRGIRGRYLLPLFGMELAALSVQRLPGVFGSLRADATWLERNFVPMLDDAAFLLKHPLVIHIDDAIWLYNPCGRASVGRLIRRANVVTAGNSFIANWCEKYCDNIKIVPTAVDASKFSPRTWGESNDGFIVGWTGSASTLRYLEEIEPALLKFFGRVPCAKLLVVADKAPRFQILPEENVLFKRWSPGIEHSAVRQMDVGIMPLDDTDIARGKCSFKMLQYMASGIPVVVSPVGMNGEILRTSAVGVAATSADDWVDALYTYYQQPELRTTHGQIGRATVLEKFDLNVVGPQIADIFLKLK